MRRLGAFDVADITDEEIDAWAAHFVHAVLGDGVEQDRDEAIQNNFLLALWPFWTFTRATISNGVT
jgi:hypothetical protein